MQEYGIYPAEDGKVEYKSDRVYKYEAQRRFMSDMIDSFKLGDDNTRVGLIGFAAEGAFNVDTNINGYRTRLGFSTDSDAIRKQINASTSAGGTYVAGGLGLAHKMFETSGRANAHKVVIVLLDGKPDDDQTEQLESTVASLHTAATVAAIGYSDANDGTALARLASSPADDWVFTALEINDLVDHLSQSSTLCDNINNYATAPTGRITSRLPSALLTRRQASEASEDWTNDDIADVTEDQNPDKCYYGIWAGDACSSDGGVYLIDPAWYSGHFGGPFASKNCGTVVTNWFDRSSSHESAASSALATGANIEFSGNIVARFQGRMKCTTTTTATPPEPSCEAMVDIVFLNDQSGSTCGEDRLPNDHFTAEYYHRKSNGVYITNCTYMLQANGKYPEPDGKISYKGDRVYKHEAQRRFMLDLIDQFKLGSNANARVSLIGFAEKAAYSTEVTEDTVEGRIPETINGYRTLLNFSDDIHEIHAAIDSTTSAGATYLAGALQSAKAMLDQDARQGAQQVVVILLDGQPSEWDLKQSDGVTIKNADNKAELDSALLDIKRQATVMAVGYSSADDAAVMETLSSTSADGSAQWAFNASEIDSIITQIQSSDTSLCKQVEELPTVTTTSTSTPRTDATASTTTLTSVANGVVPCIYSLLFSTDDASAALRFSTANGGGYAFQYTDYASYEDAINDCAPACDLDAACLGVYYFLKSTVYKCRGMKDLGDIVNGKSETVADSRSYVKGSCIDLQPGECDYPLAFQGVTYDDENPLRFEKAFYRIIYV